MTDFAALLKQYAGSSVPILPALNSVAPLPVPTVVDAKKESLINTAEAKKENFGGAKGAYDAIASKRTGYGAATMSPMQADLANLSAADLIAKYGYEQGKAMIAASANASREVGADVTATRGDGQFIGDAAIDVTTGLVGGLGAIGALGLGVVNADAGVKASELLNQATKWGQDKQSDSLNARRRYAAAQNDLADKDSTAVFNASEKGLTDNLAKIGRDVLDSVAIGASDSQTLASGIGQGVGSMLAVGPLSKGITGVGKLAVSAERAAAVQASAAAAKAAGTYSASRAAVLLAESAPTALAIGAQTGGGAYTATVADAMETLKNRTDLTQDQKIQMANDAALKAAAIAGPAGVAAGTLVAKFEANPFARVGVRTALQNTGKETLEEGIQSGASGVAQNIGIQDSVDPTRELNKELGKQIGEGALYGAGTAGAINIPAVGRGALSGTAAIAAKGLDTVLTRADRLMAQTDAASPVSDQRVKQAVDELTAVAPEAVTTLNAAAETEADPVVKNTIAKFTEKLNAFGVYDPSKLDAALPETVRSSVTGITDLPSAIQALSKVITDPKNTTSDRLASAAALVDMTGSFINFQNSNDEALNVLPDGHPAEGIFNQYSKAFANLSQSPAVQKAMQEVVAMSKSKDAPFVTEESINTPEGLKAVQAISVIAQIAPENSNVESLNVILKQAAAGKIQLTPRQKSGMMAAAALMNAAIAADKKAAANGLTELSRVSAEIQTETGAKGLSALDHGSRIRASYDDGDYATGKADLEDFMLFARHMQNKVAAVNAAFASGVAGIEGAQKYQSLGQKRKFTLSNKVLGVTPTSAGSIRFVQSIALEAERLGGIVNGLVDAFPELNVDKMELVSLVPELDGMSDTVASEFSSGVRAMPGKAAQKAAAAPVATPAPVTAPKATAVAAEPVVVASVEPKSKPTPVAKVKLSENEKSIKAIKKEQKRVTRKNPASLWAAVKGSLNETDLNDIYGSDWKRQYTLLKSKSGSPKGRSLIDRVADGNFDDFLPPKMRFGTGIDQDVGAEQDAVEYISEKLRNRDYLADDTVQALAQLNVSISQLEDSLSLEKINERIKQTEAKIEREGSTSDTGQVAVGSAVESAVGTEGSQGKPVVIKAKEADTTTINRYGLEYTDINEPLEVEVITNNSTGQTFVQAFKDGKEYGPYRDVTKFRKDHPTDEGMAIALWGSLDEGGPVNAELISNTTSNNKAKAVSEPKSQPVEPVASVAQNPDALTGFDSMKYSELTAVLEDLQNNPEPNAKDEARIAEIEDILAARVEADRAKREATEPKVLKAEPVAEPVVSANGNVFEGLVPQSRFATAFKYSKKAVSRLVGLEKPLRAVYDALASTEALKAFTDVDQNSTLASDVATAYQSYLRLGNKLKADMRESLVEFIKTKKVAEAFANTDKSDPTTWLNGKPMNITREVDGTYQYDENLLDGAVLAGLQWRITAMDRSSIVDERDAASILSLTEEQVGPWLPMLKNTMSHVEAIRAIADMLPKYWNVQAKDIESDSYAEGIPLSVAAEVFAAMVDRGVIEETVINVPLNLTGKPKTVNRYRLVEVPADKLLQTYPTAIEQAVSIEPNEVRFMGEARPPVANTQMRNSFVENSPAALEAIEAEGNTPFYLNLPLFDMYKAMGLDSVMEFFGEEADVAVTNVNHLKTLEGRNLNLASSFKSIESLVGDMENQAEKAGVPVEDFAVRYAYNMSKVNRLQQLGRFGPQASKFVRELLLPTRSTIDVSKIGSKEHKAFGLALAQGLGVKVNNQPVEISNEQIFKKLENEYSGAVDSLSAWLNDYDPTTESRSLTQDEMASIKERLGKDFTPVAVYALMEYARYKAMDKAGKKQFTTSLYVEADGVTNGPINAMMLMTTGKFTPEWINNIRKGGLFLGLGNMTMNVFRGMREHEGHVDLYQTAAMNFKKSLSSLRKSLKQQPVIESKMNSVLSLMATFLPDQVTQDAQGDLDINRSLVKNPLTVTIYGAGAAGVSSKITQALLDAIYIRMTEASKKMAGTNMSWGEAMFGAGGEKRFDRFVNDMNSLTQEVVKEFEGKMYVKKTPTAENRSTNNPKDFTLQSDEISNLSENLLKLFVTPLRQGITDTLGADLVAGAETIQQATQVQSIFMANAYMNILEKLKAAKPKGEFLSKADLKTAMGQLKAMHPLVQTEEQSYFIAGRDAADDDNAKLASSLKNRFSMPASVYGPRDAGVKGIPFLVIGMGDGVMMQRLATMMGAPEGTLKVFDGMNMKLSTITEDSEKSNEAVTESWKGNPFKAVSQSFEGMLLNGDLTINGDMLKEFQRIFGDKEMNNTDALNAIRTMGANIKYAAARADVRKQVLAEYSISVDQMASAAAPYKTAGKKQFTSTNVDEIAAELNEAYEAKLDALDSMNSSDEISAELSTAGKKSKDGTRTLVLSDLKTLQKEFNIPDNMAVVLEQVLSSLAPKGYKVIYGTPDQLAAFATSPQDIADVKSGVTSGWTSTIDKVVYLAKPSAETLVHELVHASTIETLVDHYNNKIKGDEAAVVSLAVSNMEKLMAQFLNSEERLTAVGSPELIAAYKSARQAILGFSGDTTMVPNVAKAAALNEFMAWALTNQNLATVLKTEKANPLALLAERTISLIKKLIFGRKVVTAAVNQDVFSNLLFNSSVIMAVQGKNLSTAGTAVPNSQIILKQASFNDDARLSRVQDAFDNMVVTYLNTAPSTVDADQVIVAAISRATDLALDAQANGFGMTLQESTTLQSVVAALATQAKIDPASMARAQTLYTQVTKELTIQDFMVDPNSQDPNEYDVARKKYEWLLGQSMVKTDALGRSSLLSAFLGMAIVNDELRSVLSKMSPTKIGLNKNDSTNNILENIGMNAMENLSATLSNTKGVASVQGAINALTENIIDLAERNENAVETTINNATGRVNQLNAKIVEGMNALSDYALTKTEKLVKNNPNSKAAKAVNAAAQLTSLLVSEENADAVARGVISGVNRTNLVRPIRELLSDLVGRTSTNAVIVDMIKKVRSVVQQDRQAYRENVPTVIASKFTRSLMDNEWSAMFRGMGKTDLASLIAGRTRTDTIALITDTAARTAEIKRLEKVLTDASTFNGQKQIAKSKQLAEYMMSGKSGVNLLRNSFAINNLWNEGGMATKVDLSNEIDQLVSLYALEKITPVDMVELTALISTEAEGVDFALAYLTGQREEENRKASMNPLAQANAYKGYIPSEQKAGVSLIVADDSQATKLRLRGYKRSGDYIGSNLESNFASKGYYFSPVGGKGAFTQGLLQNVNQTAGGVDLTTGLTVGGMTAGNTVDPMYLAKLLRRRAFEQDSAAPLLPVFDETGVVISFERSIDPDQLEKLKKDTNLAKMIGVWRGRQVEEIKGQEMNYLLIDNLKAMYDEDIKKGASNRTEYVNLFGKLDPVTADAMKLMSKEVRDYVKQVFGNEFMVRKDMVNDAVGYRAASVRDLWSGVSHWDPKTTKMLQRLLITIGGVEAYKYAVNSENILQNYIKDAKILIVMKSVIVPAGNLVSNMLQLLSRGVSPVTLYRDMPRKTAEIDSYAKSRIRHVEAEAELLAANNNPLKAGKLRVEIKSIEDSYRRLSIWPLINAGEFSAISDAGISREEILLTEGKFYAYVERAVSKLPESLQTAGKYALVTKDTALFQAVQKATEYGDFLGKAVLFDHLMKTKGKTEAEALAQISEEYVNYDRLPGRFRGALESNGLLWFYNFKIRSVKVAASLIRNNPLQVLLAGMIPTVPLLGNIGTPVEDNFLTILAEGRIGNSMGIGQGITAPALNPWWNLIN